MEALKKTKLSDPIEMPELPRIKLVHLLTFPEEEREKRSIEKLSKLSKLGVTYVQHINKPYTELPPKDSCRYPDRVGMKVGYYIRTPGAYGCYLAHKNAILKEFDDDVDFLLVCECDCGILFEPKEFLSKLFKICKTLEEEKDIVYVNLGSDPSGWTRGPIRETINDSLSIVDETTLADCILYQKSSVGIVKEKFLNEKWDVTDLWLLEVFTNHRKAYSKTPMSIQLEGQSLLSPGGMCGMVAGASLTYLKHQEILWSNPASWDNHEEIWSAAFAKDTQDMWDSVIHPRIKDFLKGDVLEVAPGRGRVTDFLTKHLTVLDSLELVDLSEYCIEHCRKRFGNNLKYHVNDGMSLGMIENNSKDFVFSWDSFVHMDKEVINLYLGAFFDVLKKGGHGFIHHSCFYGKENPAINKGGRSNMDFNLFAELLVKNNLELVGQEMFALNVESYDTLKFLNDGFTTFVKA